MAYTLLVLIIGTNLPSPLYGVYQHRFGFGPLVVTLIFAAYAAALVPALLLAGPLADAIGYRRVLVPAVLLAAGGTVLFAFADTTGCRRPGGAGTGGRRRLRRADRRPGYHRAVR